MWLLNRKAADESLSREDFVQRLVDFRTLVDREDIGELTTLDDEDGWFAVVTPTDLLAKHDSLFPPEPIDGEQRALWEAWAATPASAGPPPQFVCDLVYRGVMTDMRRRLWREGLGITEGVAGAGELICAPEICRQIDLDIPRTMPSTLPKQSGVQLRQVLIAVASRNPAVGYCQSMNMIAAVFVILEFSLPHAVAGLEGALQLFCPGYHGPSMAGFRRDVFVLECIVQRFLPVVHQHLSELEVPFVGLAFDPFLCLYTKVFPLRVVIRFWDVMMVEGANAVFAILLALLELQGHCFKAPETFVEREEAVQAAMVSFENGVKRTAKTDVGRILEVARSWLDRSEVWVELQTLRLNYVEGSTVPKRPRSSTASSDNRLGLRSVFAAAGGAAAGLLEAGREAIEHLGHQDK
mmetsp:Transcript_53360/g.117157  ORF Transcript_53360/g.117157 Transcript_53360/m.117157 type:complete len:409 (+) Transcript_53360:35-1261(+)